MDLSIAQSQQPKANPNMNMDWFKPMGYESPSPFRGSAFNSRGVTRGRAGGGFGHPKMIQDGIESIVL